MNAFESLIASILQSKGYWVLGTVKVVLTKDEKLKIKRPTSPRWEIDIVAYKPKGNILLAVECKSYLDSTGVDSKALFDGGHRYANRYKLFTEKDTQRVVLNALVRQLKNKGTLNGSPKPKLCLAAGRVAPASREKLKLEFQKRKWELFEIEWIRKGLNEIAADGYEKSVVSIAAKLLAAE